MTIKGDNCDGISTAMNIFLIYNIAFQLVIVVLTEDSNDPEKIKSSFIDALQLFDEIYKKCVENFFEDLIEEKNISILFKLL